VATSKSTSSKTTAAAKEFPAKAGHPDVEVDQRSADGAEGTRHVKEFVVLARQWGGSDAEHEANKAGVANEAIQRGLHPRGDVKFDGEAKHDDGQSLVLTYSVDTVPASVDHRPQDTTTPRKVLTDGAEG
jgi:hypothetical protein